MQIEKCGDFFVVDFCILVTLLEYAGVEKKNIVTMFVFT